MNEYQFHLDDLLEKLGLDNLSEQKKELLEEKFLNLVDSHFANLISAVLSKEELEKYDKLDKDELLTIIQTEKGLDLQQMMGLAITNARDDFMQDSSFVQGFIAGKQDI